MNKSIFAFGVAAAVLAANCPVAMGQTRTPAQAAPSRAASPPASPAPPTATQTAPVAQDSAVVKGSEIIARIADSSVTAEDVRATISLMDARQQAAMARDPALLNQAVRGILTSRLILKEAAAKKWDQQPAVAAQLARARDSLIVESYLQSVTAPPDGFPSEAEIKSVYDANASALLVPRRFRLAQIVVGVAKDADKAAEETARKKLDEIVKALKLPGSDFGALARSSSETAATDREGEIGWAAEPDLRPELRGQVVGLAKGGITDPIRLDDGWHILKLLDTEAAHTRPFVEVRDALVQRIRADRVEANRRAYVAELLKQAPPVVNELALSKLLEPKSDGAPSR